MKIAIPIENGRLHGHFGGCLQFALIEVDTGSKAILRKEVVSAPEHQPGLFPRWLGQHGVQAVIAGGIGRRALERFAHQGIAVRAGTLDATVEELVAALLDGRLNDSPTGCDHHEHGHEHPDAADHHRHHHHHHPHHDHHGPEPQVSGEDAAHGRAPGGSLVLHSKAARVAACR